MTVIGVVTKAIGGILGARSIGRWGSVAVGVGMVPRGEVGIVVANLGLVAGLLVQGTFSAVLVAVVLTTVIAPYLLQYSVPRAAMEAKSRTPSVASPEANGG